MTQDEFELITTDPAICHGQPTIAGTKVLVSVVSDCMTAGMTIEEILAEYPSPTEEGIRAAAAYGAALAREELVERVGCPGVLGPEPVKATTTGLEASTPPSGLRPPVRYLWPVACYRSGAAGEYGPAR
ncbi:MAG: DUF433 domain-containing protein [Acidimicrobiia bacterium]